MKTSNVAVPTLGAVSIAVGQTLLDSIPEQQRKLALSQRKRLERIPSGLSSWLITYGENDNYNLW